MRKVCNLLVAAMAMFVMGSCHEKKSFDSLGGEWDVVSIGEMAVPDSVGAFMGFDIAGQLVYGSTGCNQLTGALPAEVDPETPMFAAMGSTRMMCADMAVEDAMLPALGRVVDFKVDGTSLCFLDVAGNTVMLLEKR